MDSTVLFGFPYELHISHAVQVSPYTWASGLDCQSLQFLPSHVETLWGPGEAAISSPVTKTVCLQWKCWANTVHFSQNDDVVTLWLSHQELAVERNVDVGEELFQGRFGVQEQQPDGFGRICVYKRLWEMFYIFFVVINFYCFQFKFWDY